MDGWLERWTLDARRVRERMDRAPTARERERWHALWRLARGWSAAEVAEALERDPHAIGEWVAAFGRNGPAAPAFEQAGGPPPALGPAQQADLKAAIRAPPRAAGTELADWNWRVVREFIRRRWGLLPSRSGCLNSPRRLGFALKRPKERPLKADAARRDVFAREYALLRAGAEASGAKIFFADAAHSYAEADLRGRWVLKGEPALVDSTSPRRGEEAGYYSAVCLETGEVGFMGLDGTSTAETSAAFLRQLRANHPGPLIV